MTTPNRSNVFAAAIIIGGGLTVSFVGCSSPFDSCEAHKNCPRGGGGGEGGEDDAKAGHPPSGNGGTGGTAGTSGAGGKNGQPPGEPDAGESAGNSGGSGGRAPTGDPAAGEAGMNGAEGDMLDAPCTSNAALACSGPNQKLSLICRGGRWQLHETCPRGHNCDQTDGTCAPIASDCEDKAPNETFCSGDTLAQCGPDRVSVEMLEVCEGLCAEASGSAACVAPACGDGKRQGAEQCDDGNVASSDGCTSECQIEVVGLAVGSNHACALGGNGVVKCWGANDRGQLGVGDTQARGTDPGQLGVALPAVAFGTGRTAKAISAAGAGDFTCAVLDDDSVKCWGVAPGWGDGEPRGDQPGEMGNALPAIELGSGRSAKQLSAGTRHVCALLDNGTVKCWGLGAEGQLGLGDAESRGFEPGQMGDRLPAINWGASPSVATAVAAGYSSSCAIVPDGLVKCWGRGVGYQIGRTDGQPVGDDPSDMLGLPFLNLGTGSKAVAIQPGALTNCAILDDGSLKCWDEFAKADAMGDALPRMNLGSGRSARSVSIGHEQCCVLLDNGSVKCWGSGEQFRNKLPGYGAIEKNESTNPIDLGAGRSARIIGVGYRHACAVLDDNSVKCWGRNEIGQLGAGDTVDHGFQVADRGDNLRAVDLVF